MELFHYLQTYGSGRHPDVYRREYADFRHFYHLPTTEALGVSCWSAGDFSGG